jgi:rhodanese-related sulfurtransferase
MKWLIGIALALTMGCASTKAAESTTAAAHTTQEVTADKARGEEAKKRVADGATLLDVRSPDEYAAGHIEGAVNVPVDQLANRLAELPAKDKGVVVYCKKGKRAERAAEVLRGAGYTDVYDLGSIDNW